MDWIVYAKPKGNPSADFLIPPNRRTRVILGASCAKEAKAKYAIEGNNIFVTCEPLDDAVAAGIVSSAGTILCSDRVYAEHVQRLLGIAPAILQASNPAPTPAPGPRKPPRAVLAQEWVAQMRSTSEGRRELEQRAWEATQLAGKGGIS